MKAESKGTTAGTPDPDAYLLEAAREASRILEPRSLGVLCRMPLPDEDCPEVSDIDLLSIWEEPEEQPERITVESPGGRVFVDVLWTPVSKMLDPLEAASYKILPHLLMESEMVWMRSDSLAPVIEKIRQAAYEAPVWRRRIANQLNFGDAALQEGVKNLDFPPAALFFLQTAHSYYAMALADCMRTSTMALLSRPMPKVRRMAVEAGDPNLERLFTANLHLDTDASAAVGALDRVYSAVSARCARERPSRVSRRTVGHFAYTLSPLELEFRKKVAAALIARGDPANANFYVRFWAYAVSRCPVVLRDARLGRNPSFYVPYESFRDSVLASCPEIMEDMKLILGGDITREEVVGSVSGAYAYRRLVTEQVQARGIRSGERGTSSNDANAP